MFENGFGYLRCATQSAMLQESPLIDFRFDLQTNDTSIAEAYATLSTRAPAWPLNARQIMVVDDSADQATACGMLVVLNSGMILSRLSRGGSI